MPANEPFVIVVWGDSIAAGSKWPETAEQIFNVALNTGTPVKVFNQAVGGKPAAAAREEFDARIAPHKPSLVVIQFGFNDLRHDGSRGPLPISTPEEFAGHLANMVARCRAIGAQVLLSMNHEATAAITMPSGRSYAQVAAQYNGVTHRVALETGAEWIDMARATTDGTGATAQDVVNEDGVHLSPRGSRLYAGIMASRFRQFVPA